MNPYFCSYALSRHVLDEYYLEDDTIVVDTGEYLFFSLNVCLLTEIR